MGNAASTENLERLELLGQIKDLEGQAARLKQELVVKTLQFEALFNDLPDAAFIVDAEGIIVRANDQATHLFDFPIEQLLGVSVETLLPDQVRHLHVQHRATYLIDPHRRRMGTLNQPLYGRQRDGTMIPIDVMLGPIQVGQAGDRLTIAVVRQMGEQNGPAG